MSEEVSSSSEPSKSARKTLSSPESKGHLCQICGDVSTGFYYSVWSCEGCKAFYKRCLQVKDGPKYVCPATNSCTIDKTMRKCCQACRLRKCHEIGMRKAGARRERTPRNEKSSISPAKSPGRKRKGDHKGDSLDAMEPTHIEGSPPVKKPPPSSSVTTDTAENISSDCCHGDENTSEQTPAPLNLMCSEIPEVKKEIFEDEGIGDSETPEHRSSDSEKSPEATAELPPVHPHVKVLLENEPPLRLSGHVPQEQETEESLMTSFVMLADTELKDVIYWAKNVPGYSSLSISDKVHLVDCCFMEILICGLTWRSRQNNCVALCFAPDLICDKEHYYIAGIGPIGDRMLTISKRYKDLSVTQEEFVCLRALSLLNAEECCLEEPSTLQNIRQEMIDALVYTIHHRSNRRHPENDLANILLLLPHIRECGVNSKAHLFELKHENALPIAELVKEMLEVQEPYSTQSMKGKCKSPTNSQS